MADEDALMQTVADQTRPLAERVAAAEVLGTPASGVNYEVWRILCGVFLDPAEAPQVRVAAAHALSRRNRAAAPNQLCRYLEGDEDRRVRAAVVAILSQWGSVPETQEPRLQRDLEVLQGRMAPIPLANLASSYGGDPRVVALLRQALHDSDPELRDIAQRGLGMLGHMADVRQALQDHGPQVRAGAAETLGFYSLKTTDDVAALEGALRDADPRVQRAAKTALRRLGVQPTPKARASARTPKGQMAPSAFTTSPDPGRPEVARQPTVVPAGAGSVPYEWRPLLERWSQQWLHLREYAVELPDDVIEAGWLGYPGASEQVLQELEQRLGRLLPRSYRTFLQLTNGWRRTSPFIEHVWPTTDVDYFRARNQDWIDILRETSSPVTPKEHVRYGEDQDTATYRAEYLSETIQLSPVGDAAVYLLNPAVVTPEGEWEAWFLASWLPGAKRHPSFWDLMQAEYASFVSLEIPRG